MSEHTRKQDLKALANPYDSGHQHGQHGKTVDLGGKAEPKTSFGEPTGGLYSDPGDGTIGGVAKEFLERRHAQDLNERTDTGGSGAVDDQAYGSSPATGEHTHGTSATSGFTAGTNSDVAGQLPHGQGAQIGGSRQGGIGADDVGGMGSGTGRGRGSGTPGGVYGSGDSAGTGGMGGGFDSQAGTGAGTGALGNDIGGGVTGGTGGQGLPRRSDVIGTGGGVAVSPGRGSDLGTVGGGMEDEASPNVSGGMSGGTMGGSRESDIGGGLSGGMRSGMGHTVSGGMGGSIGDETGTAQPHGVPPAGAQETRQADTTQQRRQPTSGEAKQRNDTGKPD
jgi:hypothetical protein